MPRGLDNADRKLLIGAGAIFVAFAAAAAFITPPQIAGPSESPSSYSNSWGGAEAAFLTLEQLGYHVSRWESQPAELPNDPANDVLILASPSDPPSEDERFQLMQFLENGGRVIATGSAAAAFLPSPSDFVEGSDLTAKTVFEAEVPSPMVVGAPQITMAKPDHWSAASVRQLVVYGDGDTAAVLAYSVGKGQVIWWAAPTPLTNGAIRESGNLAFFLNCLGPPGRGDIFWDEYFHGVRGSLLGFFSRTPVFWGVAQFAIVFLAIMATYSRRLGPVRAPVATSRLSPLEFVDTLGDLYASAHVSAAAIAIAYQRFRFSLTRKLGLPIDTPWPELARLASESLGWKEAEFALMLSRCEAAAKSGATEVHEPLELFQQIHDYADRLHIKRLIAKERDRE
jgi:hypothetical protein